MCPRESFFMTTVYQSLYSCKIPKCLTINLIIFFLTINLIIFLPLLWIKESNNTNISEAFILSQFRLQIESLQVLSSISSISASCTCKGTVYHFKMYQHQVCNHTVCFKYQRLQLILKFPRDLCLILSNYQYLLLNLIEDPQLS